MTKTNLFPVHTQAFQHTARTFLALYEITMNLQPFIHTIQLTPQNDLLIEPSTENTLIQNGIRKEHLQLLKSITKKHMNSGAFQSVFELFSAFSNPTDTIYGFFNQAQTFQKYQYIQPIKEHPHYFKESFIHDYPLIQAQPIIYALIDPDIDLNNEFMDVLPPQLSYASTDDLSLEITTFITHTRQHVRQIAIQYYNVLVNYQTDADIFINVITECIQSPKATIYSDVFDTISKHTTHTSTPDYYNYIIAGLNDYRALMQDINIDIDSAYDAVSDIFEGFPTDPIIELIKQHHLSEYEYNMSGVKHFLNE